jgi:TP53 regulating kinase-like protein
MSKIIAQGAEAIITLDKDIITKNRIPKSYRLKELDEKIRRKRTEKETKILKKAKLFGINVPNVLHEFTAQNQVTKEYSLHDPYKIIIEYIDGDKLSDKLNSYPEEKQFMTMKTLGQEVSKLHQNDIIHGDLTTSNTILKEDKVFIIDFGLGFISKRIEDKAVDLHLIKQALEAKHFQNFEKLFENFKEGYGNNPESKKVFEQLKKVEGRGRYKH